MPSNAVLSYLVAVTLRSWRLFITVTKIMLPVMVVVQVGQEFGLVDLVGQFIAPAMALLNLPPEAGIIWATTLLTGIYGGIASLSGLAGTLDMTVGQFSALCAMMLIAHSIPVEQAIVRKAGAGFGVTSLLRIGTAAIYGGIMSWACHLSGTLADPISFEWLRGSSIVAGSASAGYLGWLQATAFSLALTYVIILALVLVLDGMDKLGMTRRITRALTPVLRVSGLDPDVAPVTTVGVLLGLTYGGALIIEEAAKQNFTARTRFLALSWLSLSHSLIEDTLLVVALGADVWVVLVGRVAITLAIVAALARLTYRDRGSAAPHAA